MLRASSMNVDSNGNAALYSIREAKAAFPIPPVSCFEHHFQWLCQFGGWCQPGLADFKASLYHCEYFMSVFYMQDQNDESCLFLLWSRKDCLGSRLRDKFTIFFSFSMLCFHSLCHLEHLNSLLSFTADISLFSIGPFGEQHECVLSPSVMSDCVTPCALLFMEFSRQK